MGEGGEGERLDGRWRWRDERDEFFFQNLTV